MRSKSVRGRYDWSEMAPSTAIVDTIADIEDVELADLPTVLDTTLFEQINPEALDTIVENHARVRITFFLDGYRVNISGNELEITRAREG